MFACGSSCESCLFSRARAVELGRLHEVCVDLEAVPRLELADGAGVKAQIAQ